MAIFLIRHGETELNARRVVQPPGAELSHRGRDQAGRLARRLEASGVERILSSDLERARATAEAIAGLTRAPVEFDPGLQERNFGEIRGTPYDELDVDIFAPGYAPSGGEDWPAFERRVDVAWARVARVSADVRGNLAVVTHGLVCGSIARRHLGLPTDALALPSRWENASLTVIEGRGPWTVSRVNCVEHLDGATRGDPLDPSGI
jgi:probable phosphoglycerate mutase